MRLATASAVLAYLAAAGAPAVAQEAWTVPPGAIVFDRGREGVRNCRHGGPGYIEVPGTTTCIRIGGRVRADTTFGSRGVSRDRIAEFGASGMVSLDARTDTPYGPFRTVVRVRAGDQTGRHTQAYVVTP